MKNLAVIFCLWVGLTVVEGVNSPRPRSVNIVEGQFVVEWAGLNNNHPWYVSYRDSMSENWKWEETKIWALKGNLTILRPMTNDFRIYRLWPANP